MATKLEISQLDFDGIKDNLKPFLSQQDEFTDYDFEGSGMNILLDVLAYNTHYIGYNANMLANEMYLDSADQRASVVSLAKQVGYTPRSAVSSQAKIDVLVNIAGVNIRKKIDQYTEEEFDLIYNVNVKSIFLQHLLAVLYPSYFS